MVQRTYEQVAKCSGIDDIVIATDDDRVQLAAQEFGANSMMTSPDHASGTDRVLEVCESLGLDQHDLIINVQGDEPFVNPSHIQSLIQAMQENPTYEMGTVALEWRGTIQSLSDPNVVKVVRGAQGKALYFSRALIPYPRDLGPDDPHTVLRHLGLYAFRFHFLRAFSSLPESALEDQEKLEQLRVLEAGHNIYLRVVEGQFHSGIDTPEQLAYADQYARQGLL
eukprot:CAMPEP_0171526660 /NCGR_PEP_ID=MMETSP0959-20130129/10542_1 /TAXON_ID=87120 /ORGANISM="Aurantiochytrium limacinum, Strain ATCCMYA-1381" /LENGTH=223 /DNA_ID=CAMNT_0012068159 /DNA_START=156 /DNA_END=827 /DNA_ORIENTATION=+